MSKLNFNLGQFVPLKMATAGRFSTGKLKNEIRKNIAKY